MLRRLLAPAGALACLLALAGCGPAVKSHLAAQDDPVAGLVRLTTELCFDDGSECDTFPLPTDNAQLIAAYALPDDAEVERVFTTGTHAVDFIESASYTQWLEENVALPEGRSWHGYRTDRLPAAASDADPIFSVVAEVDPPGRSGHPVAPLAHDTQVGYRPLAVDADPAAPLDCDLAGTCLLFTADLLGADVPFAGELAIRDAGVDAGDGVTLDRGTSTTVPVTVRYAGATASGALPVATTTTIPGATTEVADVSFASTGETTAPVTLKVPDTAPAGDYALTATVAGRSVTVDVHVDVPPDPKLDVATIAFPETRVGRANGPRNVLVTNPGTRALTMRGAEVVADARDFGIVADECAGRTLAPGAGCIVALQFAPTAGGDRAATLRVPTSYRDVTVPLSGNGALVPGHKDTMLTLGTIAFAATSRREVVDRGGLVFTQTFLLPGDAAWRLRLDGVLVATVLKQHIDAAGERTIRLVLTRAGRRALLRNRTGRLVLTTAVTDADGRRSVVKRSVALAQG